MVGGIPLKSTSAAFITHYGEQTYGVSMRPFALTEFQSLCDGSPGVKWVFHRHFLCGSPATRPRRQRLLRLEACSQQTRRICRYR